MISIKMDSLVSKPRMTRSDKWNKRKCVMNYWSYKDELRLKTNILKYTIGDTLDAIFHIEMPRTWTKKKKSEMDGKPMQQKPDWDNVAKAFTDALMEDDSRIYDARIRKFWAYENRIDIL